MLTPFYSFQHPVAPGTKLSSANVNRFYDVEGNLFGFKYFKYFNELRGKHSRDLYGSNISNVVVFDLDGEKIVQRNSDKKTLPGSVHVFGRHPDGTKLLGTLRGIMELKEDGSFVPNNLGVPELSKRVVVIYNRGQTLASGMEIQPLVSEEGILCGTRVTLYIRPLTSPAPAVAP